MKFLFALMLLVLFSRSVSACTEDGSSGFLPENDLNIPVGTKMAGGLSEEQFHSVIDKVEEVYAPIASNMGGTLKISRKWKDGTVNASATRLGWFWFVNMYGGLARHEKVTEDGFALVLCHEIGHHIGGAPKLGLQAGLGAWASNEGQSDYFGTLKCLRKTFLNDNNKALVKKLNPPAPLVSACSKAWASEEDRAICIRSGMAGKSLAHLLAILGSRSEPKFETPDASVVTKTDNSHPKAQCRLDTYFQGALCDVSFNEDVSQKDEVTGTCHGSSGHKMGLRPNCWFKSLK